MQHTVGEVLQLEPVGLSSLVLEVPPPTHCIRNPTSQALKALSKRELDS